MILLPYLRRSLCSMLLLHLLSCSSFNFPQAAYIPRLPEAHDFPDVGAAVLEDVATLEYRVVNLPEAHGERLVAVLDHRRRIKVLQESGLGAATVELPMDGYSTVTRVIGRSVSAEGRAVTMPNGAIAAAARADPQMRAPDVKVLRFTIPEASVGGLLEYRYERFYVDPFLVPPYVFGDALPVVRSEFGLIVDDDVKLDYRYGRGDSTVDQPPLRRDASAGGNKLVFVETDLPAFYHEPMMPHITHHAPWIAVALRNEPGTRNPRRLQNWADAGRLMLAKMFEIQGPPAAGSLAQRYHHVTEALHPLPLDGLGVRMPQTADGLLNKSPACSRDATAMLLGAFGGADVQAFAALIANEQAPVAQNDFPALYPFTQAAVAVKVTAPMVAAERCGPDLLTHTSLCGYAVDSYVYLDPMCKRCGFGVIPPRLMGGRALVVSPGGAEWVDMPLDPPQRHLARTTLKLALDVDGSMVGTLEAELRGTQALQVRDGLAAATTAPGGKEGVVRTHLLGVGRAGPNLTGARLTHLDELDEPLAIQGNVTAHGKRQDFEDFRVSAVDIGGASVPKAWRTSRRTTALTDGPRWFETRVEVQLPVGYEVQVPPPLKLANETAEYAAGFVLRGRTLHFSRRLVIKTHSIPPDQWGSFQSFLGAVSDFEETGARVWSSAK